MSELDEERLRRRLERAADDVAGDSDPAAAWRRASARVAQRRRRRRAASAAAVVLVVALGAAATVPRLLSPADPGPGVAEVGPGDGAPPQPGDGPEPGDGPGAMSDGGPQPGRAEMAMTTCRDPQSGFAIDHPERWEAGASGCTAFGTDPGEAPRGAGGSDLPGVRVTATVTATGFDAMAQRIVGDMNVDDVVASRRTTIDGRRALRWESVSSGQGAQPEGTRSTGWLIELGPSEALVLTTSDVDEGYRDNVRALDRMAHSVHPLPGS